MTKAFDLVVIGTGAAGSTVAYQCHKEGWSVAIVDSRPFGGTCALRGCDPKKVLVGAAHVTDWYRRMRERGIFARDIHLDWPALIQFKRTFTEPVPLNREEGFRNVGITPFHGRVQFVDATTLRVGDDTVQGQYVVIASGAKPAPLSISGETHLINSTEFLELDHLPEQIVFVGGGYISFEFAHIATRAGANVQILHRGERPLEGFDPDLVEQLVKASREQGIDIRLNTEVRAIETSAEGFTVHALQDRTEQTFSAALVVHGAGRVPEIDDLDLEAAGIQREKRGVAVNEFLQSVSNPSVYAAGDAAASGLPLTPVAGMEGGIVAKNLLEGNRYRPNHTGIPSVVFTIPPLASVGLQEEAAKNQGLQFKVNHQDTSSWYSSRRVGLNQTGFKVLIEETSGRILGAHLLGPHAEEVINLFAIAVRLNLPASKLQEMVYAYPTSTSDIDYMLG